MSAHMTVRASERSQASGEQVQRGVSPSMLLEVEVSRRDLAWHLARRQLQRPGLAAGPHQLCWEQWEYRE